MRNQEPSAGSASLLVLLQIPCGRNRLERAVVLLQLLLEPNLREVQRELVGRQVIELRAAQSANGRPSRLSGCARRNRRRDGSCRARSGHRRAARRLTADALSTE